MLASEKMLVHRQLTFRLTNNRHNMTSHNSCVSKENEVKYVFIDLR